MEVTLTHQVMDELRECGDPHARSLAWPGLGGAGRRARAHDMRVNGLPKSGPGPSPCRGVVAWIVIKSQLIARFLWADKIGGRGLGPIKGARQPASISSQFCFRLSS
jgi:hypothetical protein